MDRQDSHNSFAFEWLCACCATPRFVSYQRNWGISQFLSSGIFISKVGFPYAQERRRSRLEGANAVFLKNCGVVALHGCFFPRIQAEPGPTKTCSWAFSVRQQATLWICSTRDEVYTYMMTLVCTPFDAIAIWRKRIYCSWMLRFLSYLIFVGTVAVATSIFSCADLPSLLSY